MNIADIGKRIVFTAAAALSLAVATSYVLPDKAAAYATPGCYQTTQNDRTTRVDDTACSGRGRDPRTKCYRQFVNSGPVTNSYAEVNCAELTTAATVTSSSSMGTQYVKAECTGEYRSLTKENCHILYYITLLTNIASAAVGIVIVIMITWGGIQYTTAGPNPQAVADARKKIRNAILALFIYIFMFSFLQWIVPGGLFS